MIAWWKRRQWATRRRRAPLTGATWPIPYWWPDRVCACNLCQRQVGVTHTCGNEPWQDCGCPPPAKVRQS